MVPNDITILQLQGNQMEEAKFPEDVLLQWLECVQERIKVVFNDIVVHNDVVPPAV